MLRRALPAILVSLALLLQSLAPPGYMAGSLSDGWPVVLCPEGLPAGYLGHVGHGHHHDEEAGGKDLSLDGHCPLGSILDASALLSVSSVSLGSASPLPVTASYSAPVSSRPVSIHPARAPPA